MPAQGDLTLDPNAAYVSFTSNETIHGVEFKYVPETGNVPLVCDTSSDMFSRPIDVSKHALIYAGAQKNIGPAGVVLVIVKDEWLKKRVDDPKLPTMLNYAIHAENGSMYNTPPVFRHLHRRPRDEVAAEHRRARRHPRDQPAQGGEALRRDRSDAATTRATAQKDCRSLMNVTFRLPSEELEAKFAKEAKAAGLDGLKGHRSVGGMRASIYNAFPEAGVDALVSFMQEFERKNG